MKNPFIRIFRSVVEWIRPARRVQPEPRITPEQLREALADMLADPETRSLVLRNLVGNVFPVSGGSPACIPAGDVNAGQFGSSAGCTSGDYSFPARLGLGTTTPDSIFTVVETPGSTLAHIAFGDPSAKAGTPSARLTFRGDGIEHAGLLWVPDGSLTNGKLHLAFGGSQNPDLNTKRVTFQANGNVGIGTTTPGALLSLGTGLANTKLTLFDAPGGGYGLGIQGFQFRLHLGISTARFSFLNAPAGAEILTILGSGNVGIGTTNPANTLDVQSSGATTVSVLGPTNPQFRAQDTTNSVVAKLQALDNEVFVGAETNHALYLIVNNTSMLRIFPSGGLHAGSSAPVDPGANTFALVGPVNPQFRAQDTTNTVVAKLQALDSDVFVGAETNHKLNLIVNNAAKAVIDTAGNVGIGTAGPTQQLEITKNMLLPTAVGNTNGNLFFAGDTSAGANGMRLFSLDSAGGGFIDVKASDSTKGLLFRVDTFNGGIERMRITGAGNVGIGTTSPKGILDIAGKTVFLKPSPTGDDTSQINTAMSSLEASGGIVYLTPGLYLVTNLTGKSNVHLWRAGVGATTIRFTGPSGDMIKFQAKKTFSIRNITWDYNNVTADGKAIYVTIDGGGGVSTDFDVTDCSVINIGGPTITDAKYGIFVEGANNFRIERNYVKFVPSRQPNQAIVAAGTGATLAHHGIVNANHCDGSGIQADAHDLRVTNNLVHDFQFGGGITTNPAFDPGLNIYKNRNNVIIGNTVYNGTGQDSSNVWCAGIENWAPRTVISGNVCYGNAGSGIGNGGPRCVVTDNVCFDNGANNDPRPDPPQNPGQPGIEIVFGDANFDASASVYAGNRCFDTRTAGNKTQTYGIADGGLPPFSRDVTIGVNNLLENKNGPTNIHGSNYAMFLHISGGAVALSAPPSAPPDSDLNKSNISFYLLESPTNELKVKVKYSDGTIKTGTISLS